jgi:hypothetical protein
VTSTVAYDLLLTFGNCRTASPAASVTSPTVLIDNLLAGDCSTSLAWQVVATPGAVTSGLAAGGSSQRYISLLLKSVPVASIGNSGDWYLNTTTGVLWAKTSGWASTGWKWVSTTATRAFDLVSGFVGAPTAGLLVYLATMAHTINFAANFSGSYGTVGTNPTATAVFTVLNGATTIGTISISTSGVFTFATTSGTSKTAVAGDRLKITAPGTADATLADVAFTLAGTL